MRVRMAFAGVVLCASVTGVLGLIAAPSEQAGKLAGPLRIKLVGQSLIRADTRSYEPLAVEQAKSYLAGADVVFTNLEVAVAAPGVPVTKENPDDMVYSPDVIDTLKAMGFNLLALGNNHSMEFGKEGLFSTIAEVEKRGIPHAGTGKNSEEAAAPAYLKTPAGTVALVGMATLGAQLTKDKWATADRPGVNYLELRQDGTLNPADKARILRAVKEAVARAQFVIVYHHNHYWGEPLAADTLPGPPKRERKVNRFDTAPWVVAWARELIDAGAGLYVSHGNPALHGVEIYKGRAILYGLGNYIFNQTGGFERFGPLAYYGAVAEVEFAGDTLKAVRFKPLALSMDGTPEKPRGVPYLAQGGEAAAILGRLADISRQRHGTEMRVQGTSAEVVLR